jgi:hypothetical protein
MPAIIDSTGNPGIPPPLTLVVVVFVAVVVVDVTETKVESEVVTAVVDVNMVDTTVEVAVVVTSPPKGANLSIVESAFVEMDVKPGLDPTIQPLLGDVMYTELRIGGTSPRIAGEVVIWFQATPSQWKIVATSTPGSPTAQPSLGPVK